MCKIHCHLSKEGSDFSYELSLLIRKVVQHSSSVECDSWMEISVDCSLPGIKNYSTPFIQTKHFGGYRKVIKMLCPTVCMQTVFKLSFSDFFWNADHKLLHVFSSLLDIFVWIKSFSVSQLVPLLCNSLPCFSSADNYNRICFLVSFSLVFRFVSVMSFRYYCMLKLVLVPSHARFSKGLVALK